GPKTRVFCDISATGLNEPPHGAPHHLAAGRSDPVFDSNAAARGCGALKEIERAMRLQVVAAALMGLFLGGCVLNDTLDPVSDSVMSPRAQKLIKSASYLQHKPSQDWLRHQVDYKGPEKPGTVVVDTDKKFLFLVLEGGKAYRYGVTVGEEGMNWRGKAK